MFNHPPTMAIRADCMKGSQAIPRETGQGQLWLPLFTLITLALATASLVATPALAQPQLKDRGAVKNVADAITQPLSDLNLRGREAPDALKLIQRDPYSRDGLENCDAINAQLAMLDEILGPDVDEARRDGGFMKSALKSGGNFLGSFIPFRGVVRQISGAKAKQRRMEEAVYTGVARRSFLKGYAAAKACKSTEELAVEKARRDLGMRSAD